MLSVLSTMGELCVDAGMEAHQQTLIMHSEGQQINICDLATGQHLNKTYGVRRRPGKLIGSELMVGMRQQSDQSRHHLCWGIKTVGVAGVPQGS